MRLRKHQQETFLETVEYRRFQEFCDACKEDKFPGLCLGYSGVGKTLAAQNYAKWHHFSHLNNPHFESIPVQDAQLLRGFDTVVYTPIAAMSANAVLVQLLSLVCQFESMIGKETGLVDSSDPQVKLIIIDEVNRLKYQSLEHIRDLIDQLRIGVVFMGLHGFEKVVKFLPQFRNRIGYRHEFKPLSIDDMTSIVESDDFPALEFGISRKDFDTRYTIDLLVRATGGNMRTLNRLCLQVKRIMRVSQPDIITSEVIEAARKALIIGL